MNALLEVASQLEFDARERRHRAEIAREARLPSIAEVFDAEAAVMERTARDIREVCDDIAAKVVAAQEARGDR